MKLKEFGPRGGGGAHPKFYYVDPPLLLIVFLKFQLVHLSKEVGKCLAPKQNLLVLDGRGSTRYSLEWCSGYIFLHGWHVRHGLYLLMVSKTQNQNEFAWKNTKKLTTHLILALMCFLFFQAIFIMVPFQGSPLDLENLEKSWNFFSRESVNLAVFVGCRIFITFMPQKTQENYREFHPSQVYSYLCWSLCCDVICGNRSRWPRFLFETVILDPRD